MDVLCIKMVVLGKLVASREDLGNYTTYVFECLDEEIRKQTKYILCTRFPNWDEPSIKLGEIGYLSFVEITAGEDKWFDRYSNTMVPYNYNNIQFLKFIKKPIEDENISYVM